MDDDATLLPGGPLPLRRLAQYELLRQVGAGAMGVVYEARDADLGRRVAIKLLGGRDAAPDADAVERFLREARTAAQLVHPNVAIVYQVGRDGGETFIAMEWIDGTDLSAWVEQRGPMPWSEALFAAGDAAAGLSAAHTAGLVHRDVKPSNLMRTANGHVKVVDFGLARWQGAASRLTQVGGVMGSPAFMSPEQCRGEPATPASDLYALGASLYYLLTGRFPFQGHNLAAIMRQQIEEPMPDPRDLAPAVPAAAAAIVQRLCTKDPARRTPSAAALIDELRAALAGAPARGAAAADETVLRTPPPGARTALPPLPPRRAPAPAGASPALAPRVPRGEVPADATSFVGREALVAQSLAMLGSARLLTLVGPGGTGKTRLALQAARRAAESLAGGAWFVELATVPAGHAIEPAIAAALAVQEVAGRTLAETLVERLKARELLLVFDNCEQVVDAAAAFAARLLAAAPRLHLLATSRQALGVAGEEVLQVPPLELPAADAASAAALHDNEAAQLFAARARAVRPDFAVNADNAAAVAQICRRLDGIPLAIELAAARVKVLSPAQIAARLDDAFKLLVGGQRTLQQRQQTLRALFDWSFELLDPRERLLFARLSVFRGDFDLDAAEAVLSDERLDALDVLDVLTELVDRSLVVAGDAGGAMRYRLLQTTQQYAAARLGEGDEALAPARRHAEHYTRLVGAAAAQLGGKEQAAALEAITREADNARAALDRATEQAWFDLALPLASALAAYWQAKGIGGDGVARIERLLARQPPPSAALARLQQRGAALALAVERFALAASWVHQGLAIARDHDGAALEADLLRLLGNIAYREYDMDRATQHYLASVQAGRRSGNRTAEALAYHNLATIAGEQRLYTMARGYLQRTLQIARELGNQRTEAESLRNLALVEFDLGNDDQAQQLFEAGMRIHRALGDEWGSAYTLWQTARCKLSRGDVGGAKALLDEALEPARRFDDHLIAENVLDLLAVAHAREGALGRARALAAESLALRQASEAGAEVAYSLVTLAEVHAAHDAALAARLLGAAEALRTRLAAPLQARKQLAVDKLTEAVRERLGGQWSAAAFDAAFADGATSELPALLEAATRPL